MITQVMPTSEAVKSLQVDKSEKDIYFRITQSFTISFVINKFFIVAIVP
ncbi:hypothetical protein HUG15_16725 [Salicibibacter cibarius]|uniref:Uncharacterized protein n=1 Tax=Salicibibacter cibarius TaxID=2743000 RepID=A0A7T7CCK2_9BACI|nr:hypothetical protein [Salicibibacter cibarius]QQK77057.1 hypothetical protein HUG15_16725 [Salicibibacter cibarius]